MTPKKSTQLSSNIMNRITVVKKVSVDNSESKNKEIMFMDVLPQEDSFVGGRPPSTTPGPIPTEKLDGVSMEDVTSNAVTPLSMNPLVVKLLEPRGETERWHRTDADI